MCVFLHVAHICVCVSISLEIRPQHLELRNFATSPGCDAGWATREAQRCAEAAILEELQVSQADVERLSSLPQRLYDGSYNPAWLAARRFRLTAGRFVAVRRVGRHHQLARQWLKDWWYRGQERLNHKINRSFDFEDKVLQKLTAEQVGLLVHPEIPWLGASPDGLIMPQQQLLEVKSCRSMLGKKSPAWHQIQGSMAIASGAFQVPVTMCRLIDPVTWSEIFGRFAAEVETKTIRFDQAWWERFLKRLKSFYFGVFLPMAAKEILRRARIS